MSTGNGTIHIVIPYWGMKFKLMEFERPITQGQKMTVPTGHIWANLAIQNQHTTCKHGDMSYMMRKCKHCDISTNSIVPKIFIAA